MLFWIFWILNTVLTSGFILERVIGTINLPYGLLFRCQIHLVMDYRSSHTIPVFRALNILNHLNHSILYFLSFLTLERLNVIYLRLHLVEFFCRSILSDFSLFGSLKFELHKFEWRKRLLTLGLVYIKRAPIISWEKFFKNGKWVFKLFQNTNDKIVV